MKDIDMDDGGDLSPDDEGTNLDPGERRALLKKMLVGAAFAVPVVSSFSMDGLSLVANSASAAVGSNTPWLYAGGALRAAGSYAWLPGAGSYVSQTTHSKPFLPTPGQLLGAGAKGVLFSFQAGGTVNWSLSIPGFVNDSGSGSGSFSKSYTWDPPTQNDVAVTVRIANGGPSGSSVDNVSVQGYY
jgi:hypothetical protein